MCQKILLYLWHSAIKEKKNNVIVLKGRDTAFSFQTGDTAMP